ncbi:MAG: MobA/MobL family protein [Nitrososphaerota archaeon]|nr:MobA/MobL family protein [Nitrososphaerota archaeon]
MKNRECSKKDVFLEWRKSWAKVNNRMFERLGFEERIVHRSYEAQGVDKKPMIHLGYEAVEMEKRGIRTKRGDHNREVQRRNAEREALKVVQEQEEIFLSAEKDTPISGENPKNGEHTAEKTAIHLNKIKEYYTALEKELYELISQRNEIRDELPHLTYRAELVDEHAQNIEVLQGKLAELQ